MTEPVIASLAILKVNWDQGCDYIENFVPFAAECLRGAGDAQRSLSEIRSGISEEFGLTIPRGALETIMRRVVRKGYARRQAKMYYPNAEALATLDVSRMRADVLRQLGALVGKLVRFIASHYQVRWSQDDGEGALLAYLREGAAPILAAAVEGAPVPRPLHKAEHSEFLVSAFIAHLVDTDPAGFELLETVVKGSMLASSLFFPELGRVAQRFDRVEVYFDTPILLRALGFADLDLQSPHRELMDLLYSVSGELRCFEHTVEEIRGVLYAAAHALRDKSVLRSAYGETLEYFVQANYRPSDVELFIARLRQSLSSLRVRVKPKPRHQEPLVVDESGLRAILEQQVGYRDESTLLHDLDSLTAIHRLRRGESSHDIESCKAIFVTTNTSLARAAQLFFGQYVRTAVPVCLTDDVFTTLVWLKQPLSAPDLPRKKIIADCYAALNPSDTLWRMCLHEMSRLERRGDITESDYDLVRFSTAARAVLMDATFGDPALCSAVSVEAIVEEARRAARADTEAELEAERTRLAAAERRLQEATESIERIRDIRDIQVQRCRAWGLRAGRWAARCTLVGGIMLLSLCVYSALGLPFPGLPARSRGLLVIALGAALGIITVANLTWGASVQFVARRVELNVARRTEAGLMRILLPE
jgi:hypothetical protein